MKQHGFRYLLRIAYRNIYRNKRRSILCVVAVSLAVFIIISMMSYIEGMINSLKKTVQTFEVGHINLYSQEYENKKAFLPLQYPLEYETDNGNILENIKNINNVKAVLPRAATGATLTNSILKHGVLWGIDLEQELEHNYFNLTRKSDGIILGRYPEENSKECAIGLRMAKKMEILPNSIEKHEFNWILANINSEEQKQMKNLFTFNENTEQFDRIVHIEKKDVPDGKNFLENLQLTIQKSKIQNEIKINKNLNDKNYLSALKIFLQFSPKTIPRELGTSSNILNTILNNIFYEETFHNNYTYDENTKSYKVNELIAASDEQDLLSIFEKLSQLKVALKIVSSKYSDKYYNPRIVGIFNMDYVIYDETYIVIPYSRMQKLANLNQRTQTLVVLVDNLQKLEQTKNEIIKFANNSDIIVKDWEEHSFYAMFMQFRFIYNLIYGIFIILAAFLIINTIIMVIHERMKEIGMMGALGLTRKEIVTVFFLEALVLSLLGALFGTLSGGILTLILSNIPISMEAMTGGVDFQMTNTIFIAFSSKILIFGFLYGLILCSVCTIIPSLKAAFIDPVEALRR